MRYFLSVLVVVVLCWFEYAQLMILCVLLGGSKVLINRDITYYINTKNKINDDNNDKKYYNINVDNPNITTTTSNNTNTHKLVYPGMPHQDLRCFSSPWFNLGAGLQVLLPPPP